jgi:hypothetical protein
MIKSSAAHLPIAILFLLAAVGPQPAAAGVVSIGVLPFGDESGSGASAELLASVGRDLQQKLNTGHSDVLARRLEATGRPTTEELIALGKSAGVAFVVRGGLMAMGTGDEEIAKAAQLYVDVLAVETGRVSTLRADGTLASAVEQLVTAVHSAVIAPVADTASPAVAETAAPPPPPAAAAASTESDEELQQLVAQAGSLLSEGSAVEEGTLKSMREALEGLNTALTSKASQLEQGQDTAAVDQEISSHKQNLQSAVAAATDQVAAQSGDGTQGASGAQKNLLGSINEFLGGTVGVLQKIQEIRTSLLGPGDSQGPVEDVPADGDSQPVEEPVEEVGGVVTESGEPVPGVTVTDPETGATATTDNNGSYTLVGVMPGRLTNLVFTKNGKAAGTGRVVVQRGRAGVADFDIKSDPKKLSGPLMGIMPSTVVLKPPSHKATGRVSGVLRDNRGRPSARTLVSLEGLAQARSDSQGRYAFINVPVGSHRLVVYIPGEKPRVSVVQVAARGTTTSNVEVATPRKTTVPAGKPALIVRGAGTRLHGVVQGSDKRVLAGAKVIAMLPPAAISAFADSKGRYAFQDLKPGSYRIIASKAGYETATQSVVVRAGKQETRDFRLGVKAPSRVLIRTARTPVPTATRAPTRAPVEVRVARGALRGTIVDAKTGRAVAGATVSISGAGSVASSGSGGFGLGNLAAGQYRIVVRRSGYLDAEARVMVRGGDTASLTIRLMPRTPPKVRVR